MFWKVGFKGDFSVDRVRILNRRDCCGNRLAGTKVFIGNTYCGVIQQGTQNGKWYEAKCNVRVTGNQVKLVTQQNEYLSISGIEVYTADKVTVKKLLPANNKVPFNTGSASQGKDYNNN